MIKIIKKSFISFLSIMMMLSMSPVNTFAEASSLKGRMVDTVLKDSVKKDVSMSSEGVYGVQNINFQGTSDTSGTFNSLADAYEKTGAILPFESGLYLCSDGTNSTLKGNDCDSDLKTIITANGSSYTTELSGDKTELSSCSYLSFETKAKGKALSFNYVFASNEFAQPAAYNDTFALFVTNETKAQEAYNADNSNTLAYYEHKFTTNIATFTGADNTTQAVNVQNLLSQSKAYPNNSYLQGIEDDEVVNYEPQDNYQNNEKYGQTKQMQAVYYKTDSSGTSNYTTGDILKIKFAIANCDDNSRNSYVFIEAKSLGFNTPDVSVNYDAQTISNFLKGTYQITLKDNDNYYFTFDDNDQANNSIGFSGEDDNGNKYNFEGDTITISEYNTVSKEASKDPDEIQVKEISTVGNRPRQIDTDNVQVINDNSTKTITIDAKAGDEYMVLPSYIHPVNDADLENLWTKNKVPCDADGEITFESYKTRSGTTVSLNATENYVIYSRTSATASTPASYSRRSDYEVSLKTATGVSTTNAANIDEKGKLTSSTKVAYRLYSESSWKKVTGTETPLSVGQYYIRNQYINDKDVLVIGAETEETIISEAPSLTSTHATTKDTYGVVQGVKANMEYSFGDGTWDAVIHVTDATQNVYFDETNSEFKIKGSNNNTTVYFRYASTADENLESNNITGAYSIGVDSGKVRYNLQQVDFYNCKNETKLISSTKPLSSDYLEKAHTNDLDTTLADGTVVKLTTMSSESDPDLYYYTYQEAEYSSNKDETTKWQIKCNIDKYYGQYTGAITVYQQADTPDPNKYIVVTLVDLNGKEHKVDATIKDAQLNNSNEDYTKNDYYIIVDVGGITKPVFVAGKLAAIDNPDDDPIVTSRNPTKVATKDDPNNAAIIFTGDILEKARKGELQYCKVAEGITDDTSNVKESDYVDTAIDDEGELKVEGGYTYAIRYKKTLNDDGTLRDAASDPITIYVKGFKTTKGLDTSVKTDSKEAVQTQGRITGFKSATMQLSKKDDSFDDEHIVTIDGTNVKCNGAVIGTVAENGDLIGLTSYDYYYVRYTETDTMTASDPVKLEIPRTVTDFAETTLNNKLIKVIYSDDQDDAPVVRGLLPYNRVYAPTIQPGMEYYESETEIDASTIKETDWVDVESNDDIQLKDTTGFLYVRQREYDHEGQLPGEKEYFPDTYASDVLKLEINNGLNVVTVTDATFDQSKATKDNTSGRLNNVKVGMCYRNHDSNTWVNVTSTNLKTDEDGVKYVEVCIGTYDIAYVNDDLNKVNKYKTVTVKYDAPKAETAAPLNGETYGYVFNVGEGAYVQSKANYDANKNEWKKLAVDNGVSHRLTPGEYVLCYASSTPTNKEVEGNVQSITIDEQGIYTNMDPVASGWKKGIYLVTDDDEEIESEYLANGTEATAELPDDVYYVYYDGTNFPAGFTASEHKIYSFDEITYENKNVKVNYKDSVERPNKVTNDTNIEPEDIVVSIKASDTKTYTLKDNGSYSIGTDKKVNIGDQYASNITDDKIDLIIGDNSSFKATVESCANKLTPEIPSEVTYQKPTAENNGKLINVDSTMEYSSTKNFAKGTVHAINGNSVTVKSGTWYVRYKTKDNYKEATEAEVKEVFVPYYTGALSYSLNVVSTQSAHVGTGYQAYVDSVNVYSRSSANSAKVDKVDKISTTLAKSKEGLSFNQLYVSSSSISEDTTITFTATKNGKKVADKSVTVACDGHHYVTDYGYAATGASTGLTNGSHCSVCGYVNVAQQTIGIIPNAVGYTYKVGSTECRIITNTDASRTVAYKNKQNTTKYQTIPGTVNLNGQTFTVVALKRDCVNGTYVRTLTLASSITNWEYGAFNGDNRLTKINVKSTTLNVESGAFAKMKASAKAKLKVYVTKKMSKQAFNTLKAQLVKEGLKASNIRRM